MVSKLQSTILYCLLAALLCASSPVPTTSLNSGSDVGDYLSHAAHSIEARMTDLRSHHDSEHEIDISVEQKSLSKRQFYQEKKTAIIYHYTCPISRETSMEFEILVRHVYSTGKVTIMRSKMVHSIVNQRQEGRNPILYSGHLLHDKCVHYRAVRLTCDYHFFGIIDGEVYPLNITTEFMQDTEDPRLEPTVSEHCYHFGPHGEKVFVSPKHDCLVHRVEDYTVDPPPNDTNPSSSNQTKRHSFISLS